MNKSSETQLETREFEARTRFIKYQASSELFRDFFDLGFTSFQALKSIAKQYYPDIDVKVLKQMWQMRMVDHDVKLKLQNVYEKLKSE